MSHESGSGLSRYDEVIVAVFQRLLDQHGRRAVRLEFDKPFLDRLANELDIKNIPDIMYSYRSGRRAFPAAILAMGNWVIVGRGKGKYAFVKLRAAADFNLPLDLEITPIPDATPDVVLRHTKGDEQSMLVQLRYNRLIDVFTGLTAYHLQSHVRAYVDDMGQVEIDDLYLGVDTDGVWYCIPVEAKSPAPGEQLGRTQISSMVAYARQEFPDLVIRPVGVKTISDGSFFFVEFTPVADPVEISAKFYKRYQLVRDA